MNKTKVRSRRSPQLRLQIAGLPSAPSLRAHISQRIRRSVVGVQTSPVHVQVTFADVNGPKGGVDIRCAIDVQIPRTAALHATALADRHVTAFNRSATAVTRQIARRLIRREEGGRRPKKYYAARRLL